jgi:uncharacterized protein (TIGR02186 family)
LAAVRDGDLLVADLSDHLLAITTGFAGARVLLFGAVAEPGDVVVVVRGPVEHQRIRHKERFAGLWVNRTQAEIPDAPAFYRVASSRPLNEVAAPALLDRQQIGLDHLALSVQRKAPSLAAADVRDALIRLKQASGLYSAEIGQVSFIGGTLFRTEMMFPANVPTGLYTVEVYLVKRGEVASAQTTPLIVSKTGVGAEVFDFAMEHAALYGLVAVTLAAAAGWLAAAAFRRG